MNWSGISNHTLLGKILRIPLKFMPKNMVVPIIGGRLRGLKWIKGSSDNGCWLGTYEYDKAKLFLKTVKFGSTVFDIGSHVGYYTLLASQIVGPSGKVFAFEPYARNIQLLKTHLSLNNVKNTTIIEAAVANVSGKLLFKEGQSSTMGSIVQEGGYEVDAVVLDELYSSGKIPLPDIIKMDIEGGEVNALKGAQIILSKSRPIIFLATHGNQLHQECCKILEKTGYKLQAIGKLPLEETSEILAIPIVDENC